MITKKVNRYYCEFCGKSGGSAGHIHHHEERCTLNPNRVCGVCRMLDVDQPPMRKLLEVVPPVDDITKYCPSEGDTVIVPDGLLARLSDVANGCPACIMAALRQRGIPIPAVNGFNFDAEMRDIWAQINNEAQRKDRCSY